VSMVGVADRVRRPGRAAIDAVAASWTISSRGGRAVSHLRWRVPCGTDDPLSVGRRARASGPSRLSAAREAPPRCRVAVPLLIIDMAEFGSALA
jgi:hypothetical protein